MAGQDRVHQVYIGLGSNLDDPLAQLKQAIKELSSIEHSRVVHCSRFYRSKPMGPQDQADFINAVAELQTGLTPSGLLSALQAIEQHHQRDRSGQRWGPRTLDLDILLYDDLVIKEPELIVPHAGMHERDFVLYPLYDINPEVTIPGRGSIKTLLDQCPDHGLEVIQI